MGLFRRNKKKKSKSLSQDEIITWCQVFSNTDVLVALAKKQDKTGSQLEDEISEQILNSFDNITSEEVFCLIAMYGNKEVATKACERVENELLLEKIILGDQLHHYCDTIAILKIKDESRLEKIAIKKDGTVCIAAMKRIHNQNIFKEIVYDEYKSKDARKFAIKQIDDEKILAQIVLDNPFWPSPEYALENITDQSILMDILNKMDTSNRYREDVLAKIKDKSLIKEMSMDDPDAVHAITDENTLINLVKNSSNPKVRRRAVQKITNQAVLKDVVKNDADGKVRYFAVYKIKDDKVLLDVLKNDGDIEVCKGAIRNISDQNVLKSIAKDASQDYSYRREAIGKINDKAFLQNLAEQDNRPMYRDSEDHDTYAVRSACNSRLKEL